MYGRLRCFFDNGFFFAVEDETSRFDVFLNGQRSVIVVVVLGLGRQSWSGLGEIKVGMVLANAHACAF
jgi:hypothetical protein